MKNLNNNSRDKNISKNTSFITSFQYAMDGIIHCLKNERNFRTDILMTVLVMIASLMFDLSRVEMACLCITITFILMAEMTNTAIETIVDLVYDKYDDKAKIAKDVGAGAVLLAAFNSIFVGYFMFYDRIVPLSHTAVIKLQNSPTHLTFIALILVVVITLVLKSFIYQNKWTYLQGGSVSGHASVSFCSATIIALLANNTLVTILSYFIAFLVAESRVEGKIHTLNQVIVGGIIGTLVAILLFKVII
ncbi:MAG: diacylglycerol kinase [Finegoldia sp.]|uniref:diacylglycerol kinase n=1 Tax=Finegoldia sp. TaxID=1981334 RepID=UPI0025D61C2E|nr:diacylglycerol kinase [uncultured Finegoldia sp.]MDU1832116.1 diacylglycerol kinase [Finegoldia magna]